MILTVALNWIINTYRAQEKPPQEVINELKAEE